MRMTVFSRWLICYNECTRLTSLPLIPSSLREFVWRKNNHRAKKWILEKSTITHSAVMSLRPRSLKLLCYSGNCLEPRKESSLIDSSRVLHRAPFIKKRKKKHINLTKRKHTFDRVFCFFVLTRSRMRDFGNGWHFLLLFLFVLFKIEATDLVVDSSDL